MTYAIVTDSTADLTQEERATLRVKMVPLKIALDGKSYIDQIDVSSPAFYEIMAATDSLPQSSQPSPLDFQKAYQELAEEGFEGILSIHIAGVLSGTSQSASLAANQVDIPVEVIDSRGASASLALLVKRAAELRDAGISFQEAAEELKNTPTHFELAPDTLDNLLKNGRLSQDQVNGILALNVKLMFAFDDAGTLLAAGKAKGTHGVIKQFVANIKKDTEKLGKQGVRFLTGGGDSADWVEKFRAELKAKGIDYQDEGSNLCGATILTHTGLGVIGYGSITLR